MFNKYFLLSSLSVLMGSATAVHADGDVNTEVKGSGTARFFYEEHHPTKMNWDNWTFCWGANAKSRDGKSKSEEEVSRNNQGSLTTKSYVEGPFSKMVTSELFWKNNFNKKDFVFTIDFKRSIGKDRSERINSTCTTHDWSYKVSNVDTEVSTSLRLRVPENVYVLRLRTNQNDPTRKISIRNVRSIPKSQMVAPIVNSEGIELGGYQYFFTKPGEEFQIELKFNDNDTKDIELIASIEVTMIGQNRCDQVIRETLGDANALTRAGSDKAVRAAFYSIEEKLKSGESPENIDSLNRSAVLVGCFMNQSIADGILYNNNAGEVRGLLDSVSEFQRHVDLIRGDKFQSVKTALATLTKMSMVSLSSNVLDSVKPLCSKRPVFDPQTHQKIGYKRGYVTMAENLRQVQSLAGTGMAQYYRDLLGKFQSAMGAGKTYGELMADSETKAKLERLYQFYRANSKAAVSARIYGLLDDVPTLKRTAELVRMYNAALQVKLLSDKLNSLFGHEFLKLGISFKGRPDFAEVEKDITKLSEQTEILLDSVGKNLTLVDADSTGYVGGQFVNAVQDILTRFFAGYGSALANTYDGYFREFLAGLDPDFKKALDEGKIDKNEKYERPFHDEVVKCLVGYSSKEN